MREKAVIIVFLLLALTLNISGIGKSNVVSVVKSGGLVLLYPLQWISVALSGSVSDSANFILGINDLSQNNRKLQIENDILKMELLAFDALRSENQLMREKFSFSKIFPGHIKKLVKAQVISRPKDLWNSFFIIDAGSVDGVLRDDTVITPDGLVGRVIEVNQLTSKMQLLLDTKSAVTAKTVKSRVEGLLVGRGDKLLLQYVSSGDQIFIGEKVIVSSSSNLLSGIPVGYVSKISGNELDLFKVVEIMPAVNFSKIDFVYVVQQ